MKLNLDKSNMSDSLLSFSNQINNSINLMNDVTFKVKKKFNNIIVCGMGGSAIGADVVQSIYSDKLKIPIYVNRGYSLPIWANKKSLIILSSYSGNTDETVSCFNQSYKCGYENIIITTGGKLFDLGMKYNVETIQFPDDNIQPRAALGYSASILLILLNKIFIKNKNLSDEIFSVKKLINRIKDHCSINNEHNKSIYLSKLIYNKFPIIYTSNDFEVVGYRFRCQLAENTKILSSNFVFPEQNHNEIEGFINSNLKHTVILWITNNYDDRRIANRMKLTKSILDEYNVLQYTMDDINTWLISIGAKNKAHMIFALIYFLDWVSFYGALLNNTDPSIIPNINKIKSLL